MKLKASFGYGGEVKRVYIAFLLRWREMKVRSGLSSLPRPVAGLIEAPHSSGRPCSFTMLWCSCPGAYVCVKLAV